MATWRTRLMLLRPEGVRYGRERIRFPLSSHKTLAQNPNPDCILTLKCSGDPELVVTYWGGLHGDMLCTANFTDERASVLDGPDRPELIAPLVFKCQCRQTPCRERHPLRLSDPTDVLIYDWYTVLGLGREEILSLPPVFAIIYFG